MTIIKLVLVCLLLAAGMVMLPPLNGAGPGSIVTRVWLGFGILVFFAHHLQYERELEEEQKRKQLEKPLMVHPHLTEIRGYNSAQKSSLGQ